MPIIELRDVSKLYGFGDATTVALEEVSLTVDKGEFVAVMGPSGSGKSSLMNLIGLLDRPTYGYYGLNGRSVARMHSRQRARARRDRIGFVFQSYNLLPRLTVLENVALPLAYKGVRPTKRLQRASLRLEQVGLGDREYYFPRQLSGGQIQRVAIARALVNDPSIIIADEPTGNLDSGSSRVVMELLGDIHKTGNTILLVTHNPELTRYATRIVYMHDGAIVYDEKSKAGQVPARARKLMRLAPKPKKTVEDDLAGVSALMKAIPDSQDTTIRRGPAKRRRTPRTAAKPRRGKR